GERSAEQLRALRQDRADEQSPVAAAVNAQTRAARVVFADEIFRGGGEVVEDMLLVGQRPRPVPALAVLSAAAQIRLGVRAAQLEPRLHGRPVRGSEGEVETAIAIQQKRLVAVLHHIAPMRDVYKDAASIPASVV